MHGIIYLMRDRSCFMNFFDFLKKRNREIKLICFDLDNTLCDSESESETEVYIAEEIRRLLKKIAPKTVYNNTKSIDILRMFTEIKNFHLNNDLEPNGFSRSLWTTEILNRLVMKISRKDLKKYSEKLEKDYWDYYTPKIKLFPNTLNLLKNLKSSNEYKLLMLTNSDGDKKFKTERIKLLGLNEYFDKIITSNDTSLNKPAIENFQFIINQFSIDPKQCMMIGDHPKYDLINAKKLGFITVWTKQSIPTDVHYRYVDHEIKDILELLDVLKKYK